MPDFRRLGQVLYGWHRHRNFGGGQHEGLKWIRMLTFEKGERIDNPTGFDSVAGAGAAQLTVEAAAAIRGNWGFQVNITNTNARNGFVALSDLTLYQLEYLLDVNSLTMADGDLFDLGRVGEPGGIRIFIQLRYTAADGYETRFITRNDAAANLNGDWISVPDEACQIQVLWKVSDYDGADNGFCRLFVNNVEAGAGVLNLDNDTHMLTFLSMGAVAGLDAGTSGPFFLDNIRYANQLSR